MSRNGDEEAFHPHPGDPWHPEWEAGTGEDASDSEDGGGRRRLFGRRKRRDADAPTDAPSQPPQVEPETEPETEASQASEDEDVSTGPSGWDPDGSAAAWTEDEVVSAQFESAFTVGGDVDLGAPVPVEEPAVDGELDGIEEEAPAASLLDAPVVDLAEADEPRAIEPETATEPEAVLPVEAPGPSDEVDMAAAEDPEDLALAAEQALAALGAVAEIDTEPEPVVAEEPAVDVVAEELGAVEVVESDASGTGLQDTLDLRVSDADATLDADAEESLEALVEGALEVVGPADEAIEPVAEVELPSADEAALEALVNELATPFEDALEPVTDEVLPAEEIETVDEEDLGALIAEAVDAVAAGDDALVEEAVDAVAAIDDAPGSATEDWSDVPAEEEVAERLAELPTAEAAAEDLSVLASLDEEADDLDDWQAFAEGDEIADTPAATGYTPPPLLPDDLGEEPVEPMVERAAPPLAPPAGEEVFEDSFAVDGEEGESQKRRRGWRLFGRRSDDVGEAEDGSLLGDDSPLEVAGEETAEMAPPEFPESAAPSDTEEAGLVVPEEADLVAPETDSAVPADLPSPEDLSPPPPPPPPPPLEQPLSELPVIEEDADRIEITPLSDTLPVEQPEGDWEDAFETEDEPGEFLGDASRVPAGWEAPVDEDTAEVPPMEGADVEWEEVDLGEGAELQAGEMLPIEDILEPLEASEDGTEALTDTGQVDVLAEGLLGGQEAAEDAAEPTSFVPWTPAAESDEVAATEGLEASAEEELPEDESGYDPPETGISGAPVPIADWGPQEELGEEENADVGAAEVAGPAEVAAPFALWQPGDDGPGDEAGSEIIETSAEEPFAAWETDVATTADEDPVAETTDEESVPGTGLPPKRDLFAPWEEPDTSETADTTSETDAELPEPGLGSVAEAGDQGSALPWEEPEAEGAVGHGDAGDASDSEPGLGSVVEEDSIDWKMPEGQEYEGWEAVAESVDDEPMAPAADDDWVGGPPEDAGGEWSGEIDTGAVTREHLGLADAIAQASNEETELQALSAAMPGLETGVVGFEDVEDLGTDEDGGYVPPAPSDLGMRVLTGLTLLALLLGALWAGGGVLALFIGTVIMVGLVEYYSALRQKGYTPLALFGYLGGLGSLIGTWFAGPIAIPGAVLATAAVVFAFYAFAPDRRDALTNGALTVFGVVWIAGAASFAMPIIDSADYGVLVLALVAATVAMDVGAYGFGRAWGSAQLAPILSPNKSIEGLAGGVVLTIGVSLAIGYLLDPFDIQAGAVLGLVVAVLAPLGDLAESMLKRSLGVKDMGTILPGHGGVLDRVDALLFVIPAAWVLYQTLGYLS